MNYYTPSIEDIKVGYECEILWNYNYLPENEWCKVKVLKGTTEDFDLYDFTSRIPKNEIRTPYLRKEQIEAEGWEQRGDISYFYKKEYLVIYDYSNNRLLVFCKEEILVKGFCPSINEFKYITKNLLKI
jgi:hypothetical protein